MRYFFTLLLFIYCSGYCYAGGLSAWSEKTPYGHTIDHDGTAGGWICMDLNDAPCFQEFYFYKGYTIVSGDSVFAIINERTNNIQQFKTQREWETAIEAQHLRPFLKRSYNSNYSSAMGDGAFLLLVFVPVPLLLPLLWLFCLVSLGFSWQWAKGFRKHYAWIYPAIIVIVLLWSNNPQSV